MREILFRGKTYGGEWEEGGLISSLNGKRFYIGNMYQVEEVDPETVGQYTGLTDKNGKKIFEGDIVKFTNSPFKLSSIGVVCFHDGSYYIKYLSYGVESFHQIGKTDEWNDMGVTCIVTYEYEIIGNIHDNPELLKGGADNG